METEHSKKQTVKQHEELIWYSEIPWVIDSEAMPENERHAHLIFCHALLPTRVADEM